MKISRNILILFGSYLGAVALVACIGRFTVSLGAGNEESAGKDLPVDVTEEEGDIPVAVTPSTETDSETETRAEEGAEGDGTENNGGSESEPAETATVYYVRRVTDEDGTQTSVIGVYSDSGALLDVLSTPVFALPQGDLARLDDGIEVVGDEALAAILEDFGG